MTQPILFALEDGEHCPVTGGAAGEVLRQDQYNYRNRTGNISEKAFDLEASKRGWLVAINSGGAPDFDFIIKRPEAIRCVVVQVKTAFWKEERGSYCYKISLRNGSGTYSATAFDVLAAYIREEDSWLFYTRAELGNRQTTNYTPREIRRKARRVLYGKHGETVADRTPDNWELLDNVAQSLIAT